MNIDDSSNSGRAHHTQNGKGITTFWYWWWWWHLAKENTRGEKPHNMNDGKDVFLGFLLILIS